MSARFRALLPLALAVLAACERPPAGPPAGAVPAPGAGAGHAAGAAAGRVVARFGDETLTADELAEELRRLPDRNRAAMTAETRRTFVDNLVLSRLMFREGERQGIDRDPEIVRQVEDLRRRLVVQRVGRALQEMPAVGDDEVRRYYDANPQRFSETTIHARHVLVEDEARAKELRAEVVADPARFAQVARDASKDAASARQGGDLGWFGRGRMVPEFEEVAFALQPGETSAPVKSPYGWHVIRVEEVKQGPVQHFDEVREQLRMMLRNKALQARVDDYQRGLRERAGVTVDAVVIEEVAAALPPPDPSAPGHAGARTGGH